MKTTGYLFRLVVSCLLVQLCSCRTQNLFETPHGKAAPDAFPQVDSGYQYVIRANDKISISIWNHDDLSVGSIYSAFNTNESWGKWALVDARGTVNVPRIGGFLIAGLTVVRAEDSLRRLFAQWIRDPVVGVKVLNKEVTVLGELKAPGKIVLEKDDNTLVELIGRAGDFDFYANKKHIQVIRIAGRRVFVKTVDLTRMDMFMAGNIQIVPGDIIYVPSKKGKDFDKRILPIVSAITALALVWKIF